MPIPVVNTTFYPRRSRIAACLAAALGLSSAGAFAEKTPVVEPLLPSAPWIPAGFDQFATPISHRAASEQPMLGVHHVTTCDDNLNAGSLRGEIAGAGDGDTIDFDMAQMQCSTITLGSEIPIPQDNLQISGPGTDQLTIDGNMQSRIFNHTGGGMLYLNRLSIVNGYAVVADASGGCVSSAGSVSLVESVVSDCTAKDTDPGSSSKARGGAVFAQNGLLLKQAEISYSTADSVFGRAVGGAAYVVGNFLARYSTINRNAAFSYWHTSGAGGVFDGWGNVDIRYSTISGNRSGELTGIYIRGGGANNSAAILSSTISSNTADKFIGGIGTLIPLTLINTSVVLNTTREITAGAGLRGQPTTTLTMYGSIVADNGFAGEGDIDGFDASPVTGASNLVVSSTHSLPADTIHTCPRIEPLVDNGGPTRTHALKHDSPAIDQGSNPFALANDQRLAPRVVGAYADIGSVERQPGDTEEGLLASNFDGICDR